MIRLFLSFYLLLTGSVIAYIYIGEAVLQMALKDWINYDKTNDYVGAFYLADQLQQHTTSEEFNNIINNWPKLSNIPIELTHLSSPDISDTNRSRLNNGEIVVEDFERNILASKITNTHQVIRVGPMGTYEPLEQVGSLFNIAALIVIAIAIMLWLYNLQRKLNRLNSAAEQLGEGNFNVRVSELGKHKIGTLNHAFNAMAAQIEQLVKGHKSLTNAVAHELRTPVARIRFQLDMLYQEKDPLQQQNFMYGMSDDIHELGELVDELLTYARFDREPLTLKMQDHSLHHSLTKVINDRDFDSSIQLHYDDSWVNANEVNPLPFEPKHLQRAIGNLISNAQKYARNSIQLSVKLSPERCSILIDDDGPGIPITERENIFAPFKRLDDSRTRATGGYGLGLAIVKQIAQRHGGDVTIEQSPSGGARFIFSWPIET